MKLSAELLAFILADEDIHILFPQFKDDLTTIMESECYKMLEQIRDILKDDSLDDQDCFLKIEEIICVFEKYS